MLYIILENRVEDVSSVTAHAVTQPVQSSHLARATQSLSHRNAVTIERHLPIYRQFLMETETNVRSRQRKFSRSAEKKKM